VAFEEQGTLAERAARLSSSFLSTHMQWRLQVWLRSSSTDGACRLGHCHWGEAANALWEGSPASWPCRL